VFSGDNPGFDAVIGNPPYIRIQTLREFHAGQVEYLKRRYQAGSKGNFDIYVLFVERGLELLSGHGRLGFILPNKFFNAQYGQPLRGLLSKGRHVSHIVHFGHQQVFAGATTYTCLLFLSRAPQETFVLEHVLDLERWSDGVADERRALASSDLSGAPWSFVTGSHDALFARLSDWPVKLADVAHVFVGLQTSADRIYVLEEVGAVGEKDLRVRDTDGAEWVLERELLRRFLSRVSLEPHAQPTANRWILFPYRISDGRAALIPATIMAEHYPGAWRYLCAKAAALRRREGGKWDHAEWYAFGRTQNLTEMDAPKLIVQVISRAARYAYDDAGCYFTGGGNGPYYGIRWKEPNDPHSLLYLSGLLNLSLIHI